MQRLPIALSAAALVVAASSSFASTCGEASHHAPHAMAVGGQTERDIVDTAVGAGSFNTLAAALKAAGLVDTLKSDGPFTVFAPTDAAFAKLPKGTIEMLLRPENVEILQSILTFHVVPGEVYAKTVVGLDSATTVNGQRVDINVTNGTVSVDGAQVVKTDISASNGVIHVIDTVIMPSSKDIVETAVGAGSFNTLAAALDAAGLIPALQGDGPFTVFAPTDAAFAKLPKGTVESLLLPENRGKLVSILSYHVVSGRMFSDDVASKRSLTMLQGSKAPISTSSDGLAIDGAGIISADIDASNGVIHVIDTVILPD